MRRRDLREEHDLLDDVLASAIGYLALRAGGELRVPAWSVTDFDYQLGLSLDGDTLVFEVAKVSEVD